jgi:hypothetical protein
MNPDLTRSIFPIAKSMVENPQLSPEETRRKPAGGKA